MQSARVYSKTGIMGPKIYKGPLLKQNPLKFGWDTFQNSFKWWGEFDKSDWWLILQKMHWFHSTPTQHLYGYSSIQFWDRKYPNPRKLIPEPNRNRKKNRTRNRGILTLYKELIRRLEIKLMTPLYTRFPFVLTLRITWTNGKISFPFVHKLHWLM